MALTFPNSFVLHHKEFQIEIVVDGCRNFPDTLKSIEEKVLHIATVSRGWVDKEGRDHMKAHFKLGPLYDANSLVLIRRDHNIIGLAGAVNDWHTSHGSLLHVCSLGLLPEAQLQGFLPVLTAMVMVHALEDVKYIQAMKAGRAFVTAITQSPYLYSMFHRICDLHPSPERKPVPQHVKAIAAAVVARFDPQDELDEEELIIRNECKFFYKNTPYSLNRRLNRFCDQKLSYSTGDVFVLVGGLPYERILLHIRQIESQYPNLFAEIRNGLQNYAKQQKSISSNTSEAIHV